MTDSEGGADPKPKIARTPLHTGSRLIVHIGQMKTGTTGLQNYLAANRAALLESGLFFPSGELVENGHHELCGLVFDGTVPLPYVEKLAGGGRADVKKKAQALIGNLRKWYDSNSTGSVLLSSEVLSARKDKDAPYRLRKICEDLDQKPTVIAYVRSPIGGLMSRLQQSLVPNTLLNRPVWQLQVPTMIAYRDAFQDDFVLREFSYSALKDGDIVADFFTTFFPSMQRPPIGKSGRGNKSLSGEAMDILQGIKLLLDPSGRPVSDATTRRLRTALRRADALVEGYRSPKIKEELVRPLMRLQRDALELRKVFGIEFDDLDYDEIGKPCDLDLEALQIVGNICVVDPVRRSALIDEVSVTCTQDEKLPTLLAALRSAY